MNQQLAELVIAALQGVEKIRRYLFTPRMHPCLERFHPVVRRLRAVLQDAENQKANPQQETCRPALLQAGNQVMQISRHLREMSGGNFQQVIQQALKAFRIACRTMEGLYPWRFQIESIDRFFREAEPANVDFFRGKQTFEKESAGLFHVDPTFNKEGRGGYSYFIPDTLPANQLSPLIIALHGGFGHGRDFIWAWVRTARSRGYILLAPTSRQNTWSVENPAADWKTIETAIQHIHKKWPLDTSRVILSGISDGGTYALASCMKGILPNAAFAVIACTMPPGEWRNVSGRPIYWVHGMLDWMFPAGRARLFSDILKQNGAHVTFREHHDLSHAYPDEENIRILNWFEGLSV